MATAAGRKDQRQDTAGPSRATPARQAGSGSVVGISGSRPEPRESRIPESSHIPSPGEGVLVIGREIEVRGEIGSCRTLVVEGRLEAAVEVGSLELAEHGLFDGRAEVETADIAGRFEGELTARGELRLRPTARVHGVILYGRVVIEGGGEISGEVGVLPENERLQPKGD